MFGAPSHQQTIIKNSIILLCEEAYKEWWDVDLIILHLLCLPNKSLFTCLCGTEFSTDFKRRHTNPMVGLHCPPFSSMYTQSIVWVSLLTVSHFFIKLLDVKVMLMFMYITSETVIMYSPWTLRADYYKIKYEEASKRDQKQKLHQVKDTHNTTDKLSPKSNKGPKF